jgi:hypothetical protein
MRRNYIFNGGDIMVKGIKSKRIGFIGVAVFSMTVFFGAVCAGADEDGGKIAGTKDALEKWVETKRIISKERRDLKLSREILNERIRLVEREIESLREKISDAEESIAEADKKRAEMLEENEKLKAAAGSLEDILVKLEGRTKELLVRLPGPIRERVKPLSQRLPVSESDGGEVGQAKAADKVKKGMGERFQNVVGILNEVDKFNRDVSVTSEVRKLEGGKSVEVTALYAGTGHGFYTSADGKYAGYGFSGDDGWVWVENNASAGQVAEAIAILKNEKAASFVQLPVDIKDQESGR